MHEHQITKTLFQMKITSCESHTHQFNKSRERPTHANSTHLLPIISQGDSSPSHLIPERLRESPVGRAQLALQELDDGLGEAEIVRPGYHVLAAHTDTTHEYCSMTMKYRPLYC